MFRRRSQSAPRKQSNVVFKKLLDFLQSSMWQLPTSIFVEQNSLVFDNDQLEPGLFKAIHNEYRKLVDSLLSAYCEDSKIETKDLVDALKNSDAAKNITARQRDLLEPVVAAEDFACFVPMMMRKNIELQLQALKLMQHITGAIPTAMTLAEEDAELWNTFRDEDECERFILISVIRKSREDYANATKAKDEYWSEVANQAKEQSEQMLKSIEEQNAASLEDTIMKNLETGLEGLLLKSKVSKEAPKAASKSATKDADSKKPAPKPIEATPAPAPTPVPPPARRRSAAAATTVTVPTAGEGAGKKRASVAVPAPTVEEAAESSPPPTNPAPIMPTSSHFDYRSLLQDREEQIPKEMVQQRALYLRQKRDKLLQLKREEQEKHLIEETKKMASERPKTASVARKTMVPPAEDPRKALASKLRSEVVDADVKR